MCVWGFLFRRTSDLEEKFADYKLWKEYEHQAWSVQKVGLLSPERQNKTTDESKWASKARSFWILGLHVMFS